jgi:hypothetical protein
LRIENEKGCLARDSRETALCDFRVTGERRNSGWRGAVRGESDARKRLIGLGEIDRKIFLERL